MNKEQHKLISYAHKQDPSGTRFIEFENAIIPSWAVNIKPYYPPNNNVKQTTKIIKLKLELYNHLLKLDNESLDDDTLALMTVLVKDKDIQDHLQKALDLDKNLQALDQMYPSK